MPEPRSKEAVFHPRRGCHLPTAHKQAERLAQMTSGSLPSDFAQAEPASEDLASENQHFAAQPAALLTEASPFAARVAVACVAEPDAAAFVAVWAPPRKQALEALAQAEFVLAASQAGARPVASERAGAAAEPDPKRVACMGSAVSSVS